MSEENKDMMSYLRSLYAVLAVLVVALLAQMPHAQHVFYLWGHDMGWFAWFQSWGFAIALEVAVLVFVVRGNVRVSWGFAAFSVAINLVYYTAQADGAWYWPSPSWLLSAGLPVAIALYSHEVSKPHDKAAQVVAESPNMEPKITEDSLNSVVVEAEDAQVVADEAQAILEEAHIDDAPTSEPAQLDNVSIQIIDAIRSGATTPYAISKRTGIAQTTLKRKQGDMHIGRLPQLVAAGHLTNGGSEYRIANA